jgi:acetylglutamate kinase
VREHYQKQVETLLEALPYIRRFSGKTVVIKYGGAAMSSADLKEEFATDIALLRYVGVRPIIVHGGGSEVSAIMERLDLPVTFVDGLRVTDPAAMEVAKMVLVGKVNKEIVQLINHKGAAAVGLSGDDGRLMVARRLERRREDGSVVDLGQVGEVVAVNTALLDVLEADYVPVVASVGVGEDGLSYNINADTVAGALAAALQAEKVIFLTDVAGLHEDVADPSTYVSQCSTADLHRLIAQGHVRRGMIPKLEAVLAALDAGVAAAHLIDGRVPHSVLLEILTDDAGVGTKILPEGAGAAAAGPPGPAATRAEGGER